MTDIKQIYKSLFNYFSGGYSYQMQNVYLFRWDWESDFFCLNREGYSFEMEVKVSRADFKADFKKQKHRFMLNQDGKILVPNRFYYVTPVDLISKEEVPSYAGLIYSHEGHCMIMKRAPFLHRKKFDFRKKLCDKFYYQWLAMKKDLVIQQRKCADLESRINSVKQ